MSGKSQRAVLLPDEYRLVADRLKLGDPALLNDPGKCSMKMMKALANDLTVAFGMGDTPSLPTFLAAADYCKRMLADAPPELSNTALAEDAHKEVRWSAPLESVVVVDGVRTALERWPICLPIDPPRQIPTRIPRQTDPSTAELPTLAYFIPPVAPSPGGIV